MRPRIAVNCDVEGSPTPPPPGQGIPFRRERAAIYTDYLDAIYEAGGEPWVLPPDPRALGALDQVQGLVLVGGDDYSRSIPDPGAPPPRFQAIAPRREEFDIRLLRGALERDLPLLGVCAGLQLLVIEGGGRIIGDIEDETPGALLHRRRCPEDDHPRHAVRWSAPGPPWIAPEPEEVMSCHHQGVAALPDGWRVWGTAPDGVIEGAVGPGRWQVAVQWHPEHSPRDPFSRSIFSALVAAAAAGCR
jgi:putative glutamine amidotransferase